MEKSVKGLVSLGFFDEDSFENGYLTSKEIQNQYRNDDDYDYSYDYDEEDE